MTTKLITSPIKKFHKSLFKPTKYRSLTQSEGSDPSYSFRLSTSALPPPPPSSSSVEAAYDDELGRQAFRLIDSDGDGKITKLELHTVLSMLGGGEDDVRRLVDEADSDGDGCIDMGEFCVAIGSAFAPPACDAEVRETFAFFDSDGDGRITAEELHRVFKAINGDKCTLEECKRMIRGVDRNGDGVVCFEEFKTMMDNMTAV